MKKTVCFLLCLLMVLTAIPVFAANPNNSSPIQWKKKTDTLYVSDQYQFSVQGNGGSSVYWSSSDTSVAAVSSKGLVTATGFGTARITATCNGFSVSAVLDVNPKIVWGYAPDNMVEGEVCSFLVNMRYKNNSYSERPVLDTISWNSSNPSVARVDQSGKVRAYSLGTTTITATYNHQTLRSTVRVGRRTISWKDSFSELYIGTNYAFSAISSPFAPISWRSSDTKVAKVSGSGLVTPVSEGSAYIYAETSDASSLCQYVTVKKPYLAIGSYVNSMKVGESVKFYVNGGPSKTPVWRSSDTRIATVSADGTVKAVSSGTVTITATGNGSSSSVRVTVSSPSLTIISSKYTLPVGSSTRITAYASPAAKIQWSSSNTSVARVDTNGTVRGVREGTATIYAKANGVTRSVTVTVQKPLSISGVSVPASVKRGGSVSPRGTVTSGSKITSVKVEVYSSSGTLISRRTARPSSTVYILSNMGSLSCGAKSGKVYYKVTATDSSGETVQVQRTIIVE